MNDTNNGWPPVPDQPVLAEKNGAALDPHATGVVDPMEALRASVEAAQAKTEASAEKEVTIADVAAAAFTALETVVAMLPQEQAQNVIEEFEARAQSFAEGFEEEGL